MKRILLFLAAFAVAATLEHPRVSIILQETYRLITSNGLPEHPTGQFPNRNNPNTIAAQDYHFRVPAQPKVAARIQSARGAWFGVAVNGVPFEPGTAEFWDDDPDSGWVYEAKSGFINLGLDENNAHVQ